MATVIIKGLTMAQAKTFVEWYEGQGEQDAEYWFEEHCEDSTPIADTHRPGGCYKLDEEAETVTMHTKTFSYE